MGGSGLEWTDDFQKFSESGPDQIQFYRTRTGLELKISQSAHLCILGLVVKNGMILLREDWWLKVK